jgi:hypothetical protein
MTGQPFGLDTELARFRRISLDISVRTIAGEVGFAEAAYRRIEDGVGSEHLTIAQLGRLAAVLHLDPHDLLRSSQSAPDSDVGPQADEMSTAAEDLVATLGPLLFHLGRAVPVATLADLLGSDSATVESALARLRDQLAPGGLVVSVGKPGATLVPAHTAHGASKTRRLLRLAEQRGALNSHGARLLHQLAGPRGLPSQLKQRQRKQLSILAHAGWVGADAQSRGASSRFRLSDEVAFSLVLDDGEPTETAIASVWTAPTGRAKFKWLQEV